MSFSPELMDGQGHQLSYTALYDRQRIRCSQLPDGAYSLLVTVNSGLRGQSWRQPLCFSGHGVRPAARQVDFAVAGHAVSDLRIQSHSRQ